MASEDVGGLYVSVGLDAKPALNAALALQREMDKVAASINRVGKTNLAPLRRQFDDVAKSAERAANASAKVQASAGRAAAAAATAQVQASARAARQQIQNDQAVVDAKLRLQRQYFERVSAATRAGVLDEVALEELKLRSIEAGRLRGLLQYNRISVQEFSQKQALLNQELAAVERTVRAEVAARARGTQQTVQEAQKQVTLLQAIFGRSQALLIGAGAFKSGNFFYGAAAVGGYFKSLFDGLKAVKSGADQATGAIDALGAAAGPKGMAYAQLAKAGLGIGAAAAALAAVVPIVGVVLTAVGTKIAQFGLEAAMNLEMLKIQYEGLLGSASAAQREVESVLRLGTTSIVPTEQLLDANRLLLAFGVNNEAARRSTLEYISAFSSVTGASLTQVQNLSYALGQINAAGKANAIDLRQLANAGVSTQSIYEEIAKQQNITVAEAKNLSDEGKLYASVIMPAILAQTEKLRVAEDKARESARGILLNLKDIATIKAGAAFENLLSSLKPVLKWVESFIKAFDFSLIAKAFQQVVGYFQQAFKGMGANASKTSKDISATIAKAVNVVGYAAVRIAQFVVAVFDTVMVAVNFVWAGIQDAVAKLLYTVSAVMEAAAAIPGPWQESARQIADSSWTAAEESSAGARIASQAWVNGASAAGSAWANFLTQIPEFKGINPTTGPDRSIANLDRQLKPIGKPIWNQPIPEPPGGASGADKANQAIQDYLDRTLELLEKARDAGKKLAEELTLPFAKAIEAGGAKVKTAAEKAFSSMDIDTIVGKFSELQNAVKDFYAPLTNVEAAGSKKLAQQAKAQRDSTINSLRSQTYELVRLASENQLLAQQLENAQKAYDKAAEGFQKSREKLDKENAARQKEIAKTYDDYYTATSKTEGTFVKGALTKANEALDAASKAYESAKEKLDSLRQARDSFLESVADSLRSFVNNLSNVTKEIQTYTRLDDIGSFALTTDKRADLDSFKRSLQERLDALKTWRMQVADLMSRGLDSNFLKSLVSAGPEGSKDVVAALAGASSQEIADINQIQAQLNAEILTAQQQASAQWFDAGIAAQEAFTAPLKTAYDAAQKQVADLTAQKDLALGVLNAWYTEQNELIATQEQAAKDAFDKTKADLELKMAQNQTKAEEIAAAINGIWTKLPGAAYTGGVNTMISLIEGLKSKEKELKAEANRIANILENTIRRALRTNSPSKVMESIGEDVMDGLILGMQQSGILQDTTLDLSPFVAATSTLPDVQPVQTTVQQDIRVYLGDKELTDLVDVQITQSNNANTDLVIAGRRY